MSHKDFIASGVQDLEPHDAQPTGHVETDGKCTTIRDLPTRSMGPNSIKEVTLDENVSLPHMDYGGKK
jgi:hypothetical protein